MTKAKSQNLCNEFNERFPAGTQVVLRHDDGSETTTTVRHGAQVLANTPGYPPVAWFIGIGGGVSIEGDRVRLAEASQRSA